jgi:predicted phage-related endonuclease
MGAAVVTVTIRRDLTQGTPEWIEARRGLITASEMKLILTPATLKQADNDKARAHLWELLAQRITGRADPHYVSDDMLRGQAEEAEARYYYSTHFHEVEEVGFITNDRLGFVVGYSPDGLVGDEGLVECKSRRQRFQVETLIKREVPAEFVLQLQTALFVSERRWIDFCQFSAGLPLFVQRVYPDDDIQQKIHTAAAAFEAKLAAAKQTYDEALSAAAKIVLTEWHESSAEITL